VKSKVGTLALDFVVAARSVINSGIVKFLGGAIALVTTIVSTAFFVDSRYAHAESFEADKSAISQALERNTLRIERQALEIRRDSLEDKLFELDARRGKKGELPTVDEAQYRRYSRNLEEVTRTLGNSAPRNSKK
jgi:hypothetical protein